MLDINANWNCNCSHTYIANKCYDNFMANTVTITWKATLESEFDLAALLLLRFGYSTQNTDRVLVSQAHCTHEWSAVPVIIGICNSWMHWMFRANLKGICKSVNACMQSSKMALFSLLAVSYLYLYLCVCSLMLAGVRSLLSHISQMIFRTWSSFKHGSRLLACHIVIYNT